MALSMVTTTPTELIPISTEFIPISTMSTDTHTLASKQKYLFTRRIMNVIIQHGGAVFGGAVRDVILHSYHAAQFYEKYDPLLYNDPKVAPELRERFLVPKDIDFMLKIENVESFMKTLYQIGCYIKILKKKDLSYFTDVEPGEYQLRKLHVVFNGLLVGLDMVVCFGEFVFPNMNHDFDVNQLLQTHKLSAKKGDLAEISKQIEKKIATCNPYTLHYRIENMMSKGWKVLVKYNTLRFQIRTNEMLEHCVICMDDLQVGGLEVKESLCECNYSYCKNCLQHSLKLNCLMCKKEVDKIAREMDISCFEEFGILG